MRSILLWIGCALALSACAASHAASTASPTPVPSPLLIESRGVTMPLQKVVQLVAYRIHPPNAQVLSVAVIPPLGGDDLPTTRGVAFEYATGGSKWLLSEWPAQKFHLTFGGQDASAMPCAPVAYSDRGVAWTTRDGLAMTLQPDGPGSIEKTTGQARSLFARLACR